MSCTLKAPICVIVFAEQKVRMLRFVQSCWCHRLPLSPREGAKKHPLKFPLDRPVILRGMRPHRSWQSMYSSHIISQVNLLSKYRNVITIMYVDLWRHSLQTKGFCNGTHKRMRAVLRGAICRDSLSTFVATRRSRTNPWLHLDVFLSLIPPLSFVCPPPSHSCSLLFLTSQSSRQISSSLSPSEP